MKNIVTIVTVCHSNSLAECAESAFSKAALWSRLLARSVRRRVCHRHTLTPRRAFGERKTCLQVAFLMGVPVKSAFALLLTKVTKPENVEIYRWEMKKCRER